MTTRTENFRRQHSEILQLAQELESLLTIEKLEGHEAAARSLLSRLAGKLNIHLAMEDKALYPALQQHAEERVRSLAKTYIDEMGGIAEEFARYMANWPSANSIKSAPGRFISETGQIFSALAKRIERENNELYPLIDQG